MTGALTTMHREAGVHMQRDAQGWLLFCTHQGMRRWPGRW